MTTRDQAREGQKAQDNASSCGRVASKLQDAAEPAVDIVHEGFRQVAGRYLKVSLVEGDQRGDVSDCEASSSR